MTIATTTNEILNTSFTSGYSSNVVYTTEQLIKPSVCVTSAELRLLNHTFPKPKPDPENPRVSKLPKRSDNQKLRCDGNGDGSRMKDRKRRDVNVNQQTMQVGETKEVRD